MNISEAKQIRIVDFLAKLGHRAQYVKSEQYWYRTRRRSRSTTGSMNGMISVLPREATLWNWGSTCTGQTA